EHESGPATPLWLREGLVETWSEPDTRTTAAPAINLAAIDAALAHSSSEAESETAHRAAAWYAARLLDHYGRAKVLEWLRSCVPDGVVTTLTHRKLCHSTATRRPPQHHRRPPKQQNPTADGEHIASDQLERHRPHLIRNRSMRNTIKEMPR